MGEVTKERGLEQGPTIETKKGLVETRLNTSKGGSSVVVTGDYSHDWVSVHVRQRFREIKGLPDYCVNVI